MDFSNLSWAPPEKIPGLMQMAQMPIDLPTNDTSEGAEAAREYAKHLLYSRQMQYVSDNPQYQPDRNTQDTLATTGANYSRANNITYDPPPTEWREGPGFNMGGQDTDPQGRGAGPNAGQQGGGGGSGFYMGGKPVAMPIQGDVGRQLHRLPQHVRDIYGPSVVQHIRKASPWYGTEGRQYPGSLAYMLSVPEFEAGDSFRLNRDAWGRGFGLGSSDTMHPARPWP